MCLVIRFPLLFGNVRACTLCAWFSAKIAVGECPWLLHWFHQNWWNGGLDRRSGPPNETAVHTWLILISRVNSAVYSVVPKPSNETAVGPLFLSCPIRRFDRRSVAAEWNSRSSPASLGTHSAVTFYGLAAEWNRRSVSFKGNHVFSLSHLLASINTSFSLVLIVTLIIKNPIFKREKKQIRLLI